MMTRLQKLLQYLKSLFCLVRCKVVAILELTIGNEVERNTTMTAKSCSVKWTSRNAVEVTVKINGEVKDYLINLATDTVTPCGEPEELTANETTVMPENEEDQDHE